MRFIILFIYLTCFSSVVFSQNKKLAVIGSSTAKGYGLANPETESWVNRVRNYYVAQGVIASPAHVVNLAQSGTNCVTGMPDGYVSPYTTYCLKALTVSYSIPLENLRKYIPRGMLLNEKASVLEPFCI